LNRTQEKDLGPAGSNLADQGGGKMRLGEMSWTEVREAIGRGASAIIPLGSIEEHGPHCPMGDYAVVDAIAARTGEATDDLVAPTMPFGYSEYFRHYPGTITVRPETLAAVVEDVVDCLLRHDVKRIVIFNGHAGNGPIVELTSRRILREWGLRIPSISPLRVMRPAALVRELYGADARLGHGGEPMGSVMMALQPGRVHLERAGSFGRKHVWGMPTDGLNAILFQGERVALPLDMRDVTPETGSLSDPSPASESRGRALLDTAVKFCIEFMNWFRTVDPWVEAS
jgi:creatinine amidohydrolase